MKQGWTGATLPIGVTTRFTQNYDPRFKVKIAHDNLTKAKLYIYLPYSYSDFTYTLNGSYVSFAPSNTELSSAPTTDKESTYYGLMEEYLTDEKAVGTWIDGTPIYKKTVDLGNLPASSIKTVAHGISNPNFIKIEGVIHDGNYFLPLPYVSVGSMGAIETYSVTLATDATYVYLSTATSNTSATAYATLYYTKTQ